MVDSGVRAVQLWGALRSIWKSYGSWRPNHIALFTHRNLDFYRAPRTPPQLKLQV